MPINTPPTPFTPGAKIPDAEAFSRLGSDYAFLHITDSAQINAFINHPHRINAVSIVLCLGGAIEMEINTQSYTVSANTLLFISPGDVLHFNSVNPDGFDLCTLILSTDFVSGLNFDINVMSSAGFKRRGVPMLSMAAEDMLLLKKYFDLMHLNTTLNTDAIYVKSISRNLIAAAIYQIMQLGVKYMALEPDADTDSKPSAGGHNYVREFMSLVYTHHTRQRNVAFYAELICLSPKYLSRIIKESTGWSAARWIDHFVILEAKNLLRYSGKNVQQVAYDLNFANQSAFGKYFKHITGMSPTEFQKN